MAKMYLHVNSQKTVGQHMQAWGPRGLWSQLCPPLPNRIHWTTTHVSAVCSLNIAFDAILQCVFLFTVQFVSGDGLSWGLITE